MSAKRIAKELGECTAQPPTGTTVKLANEGDLHVWHVTLEGPPSTPYAGGKYGLVVKLPIEYPFKAPVVTFTTRIYHPNVTNDNLGNICLGILKSENWKPANRLHAVLEAVRSLLVEPQPDDPLETRIADEYKNDRKGFEHTAKQYTSKYAAGDPTFTPMKPA